MFKKKNHKKQTVTTRILDTSSQHPRRLRVYVHTQSLGSVRFFVSPWTVAHLPSRSMGFFRQEYWSGLPFPSPGNCPNPGIEPGSFTLQAYCH